MLDLELKAVTHKSGFGEFSPSTAPPPQHTQAFLATPLPTLTEPGPPGWGQASVLLEGLPGDSNVQMKLSSVGSRVCLLLSWIGPGHAPSSQGSGPFVDEPVISSRSE